MFKMCFVIVAARFARERSDEKAGRKAASDKVLTGFVQVIKFALQAFIAIGNDTFQGFHPLLQVGFQRVQPTIEGINRLVVGLGQLVLGMMAVRLTDNSGDGNECDGGPHGQTEISCNIRL